MSKLLSIPGVKLPGQLTVGVLSPRTIGMMLNINGLSGEAARTILLTRNPSTAAVRAAWGPDIDAVATNKDELLEALQPHLEEQRQSIDPCPFGQYTLRPAAPPMGPGIFPVGCESVFLADLDVRPGEEPGEALARRLIDCSGDVCPNHVELFGQFCALLEASHLNPSFAPGAAMPPGFDEELRAYLYSAVSDRFAGRSLSLRGWREVATAVCTLVEAYRTALLGGDLAEYSGTGINGAQIKDLIPLKETQALGAPLRRARRARAMIGELIASKTQLGLMALPPIRYLYALFGATGTSITLAQHRSVEAKADAGNAEHALPAPRQRDAADHEDARRVQLEAVERILRGALSPPEQWDTLEITQADKPLLQRLLNEPATMQRLREMAGNGGDSFIAGERHRIEQELYQPPREGLSLEELRQQIDNLAEQLLAAQRRESAKEPRTGPCESDDPAAISAWAVQVVMQIASPQRAEADDLARKLKRGLEVFRLAGLDTEAMLSAQLPDLDVSSSLHETRPSEEVLLKLACQLGDPPDVDTAWRTYQETIGHLTKIQRCGRDSGDGRVRGLYRRFQLARWIECHWDKLQAQGQDGWLLGVALDLVEHSENGTAALLKKINPKDWVPPQHCQSGWLMQLRNSLEATYSGATQFLFPWQGELRAILKIADELPYDRQLLLFVGTAGKGLDRIERSVLESERPTFKSGYMTVASEASSLAMALLSILPSALPDGADTFLNRLEKLETERNARGYTPPLMVFGTGGITSPWEADGLKIGARLDGLSLPALCLGPALPLDWSNEVGPAVPAPLVLAAWVLGVDLGLEARSVADFGSGRFRTIGTGASGLAESLRRLLQWDGEYSLAAELRALAIDRLLSEVKHLRIANAPAVSRLWQQLQPLVTFDPSSTTAGRLIALEDGRAPVSALGNNGGVIIVAQPDEVLNPKDRAADRTSFAAGWFPRRLRALGALPPQDENGQANGSGNGK